MGGIRLCWLRRTAAICVGLAALALLVGRGMVVREVQVVGAEEGDAQMIVEASGIEAGDHLLLLDWQTAEQGISSLGKYRLEEGETTFTGRATLHVLRRESAAMLGFGEGVAVVDGDMRVIELRQDAPDRDVLFISGMDAGFASLGEVIGGDEARVEACRAVMAAARISGVEGFISEVNVEDAGNIRMIAGTGMRILLGDGDKLAEKLSLARAAVLDIERRGEGGGVLDVVGVVHADYTPAGLERNVEPVSTDL